MKKTNTSNPLKFFNDNKDKDYKKAGGEMAAFKKSLTKAQDGRIIGPMTQEEAAQEAFASPQNEAITNGKGPRLIPKKIPNKLGNTMPSGMLKEMRKKN
jgi:hypothetical protein